MNGHSRQSRSRAAITGGEAAARPSMLQRAAEAVPGRTGDALGRLDVLILRLPQWLRQFAKFAVVGATGTAINFAVFSLIIALYSAATGHGHFAVELFANAAAFCVAVVSNFTLNRYWTFQRKSRLVVRFSRFFLVSLAGLGLNLLFYTLLHAYAGTGPHLTQLLTILLVMPFNFIGSKFWAFR